MAIFDIACTKSVLSATVIPGSLVAFRGPLFLIAYQRKIGRDGGAPFYYYVTKEDPCMDVNKFSVEKTVNDASGLMA